MDREGVPEDVDVARGLADTVAMLENKARAKSVGVRSRPPTVFHGPWIRQRAEPAVGEADRQRDRRGGHRGTVVITATARGDSSSCA